MFENFQPYFTRDDKHHDRRNERRRSMETKCERKVLYFKEDMSAGASVWRYIINISFKDQQYLTHSLSTIFCITNLWFSHSSNIPRWTPIYELQ